MHFIHLSSLYSSTASEKKCRLILNLIQDKTANLAGETTDRWKKLNFIRSDVTNDCVCESPGLRSTGI